MEVNSRRFRLYKILHGPVKQAFLYVFHQTYAQNVNVYEFAMQHTEYFTEGELLSLQTEKKVIKHDIPLLYTIIKSSCNPPLAPPSDALWSLNSNAENESKAFALEKLLAKFLMMYEEAAHQQNCLEEKEFNEKIANTKIWLQHLMEKTGEYDVTGRWKENLEKLESSVVDIENNDVFPSSVIGEDIRMEVIMCYHHYSPNGLNPLKLKLGFVPESQAKKSKHRKDPEVILAAAELVTAFSVNNSKGPRKVCIIKGDHGCGKSNLVAHLASSWCRMDDAVKNICSYEAVVTVSALYMRFQQLGLMESLLPLCTLIHGKEEVQKWLSRSKILLIVDDAEELSIQQSEELGALLKESNDMNAVILTSPNHFDSLVKRWANDCIKLELCGFGRKQIIKCSEQIMCIKNSDFDSLKEFLTSHICRLELVLKHPVSLTEICDAWIDTPDIFEDVTTCSDLLWVLTRWKINKVLKNSMEIVDISKIKDLLLLVGSKAFQAIKDGKRYEGTFMDEVEKESGKLFISISSRSILSSIFKYRYLQHGAFHNELSSLHKLQEEFFAAWYVAHLVIDGKQLKKLLEGIECPYHMAIFMAGLLPRMQEFKWISGMHERKLIKAAVNHTEGSDEDLNFNLDLVTEVKGMLRLVEIIVDFSEYPDEWNVDAGDIQLIPFQALLFQVAPTRIFLNVEELKPYSELEKVTSFLCKVDIFAWLDSGNQFTYGNDSKMDPIAKAFFSEKTKTRIDLVKGHVSNKVLKEITSQVPFSYLVFLKLRVVDMKNLSAVLKAPKHLPKLLWLEIKFDFPVLEEDICSLPKTVAPLLDMHLQGLDDSCVSKLANLLGSVHDCYTGIHLEDTTFTPEGVFVLLKQLQKRKVNLHCPAEYREKFRRWYYPQLSGFDKSVELTDALAMKLLGFDDRMYYSNHNVSSSCFAIALDSWNLASYLEEEKDIVQFTYKTDNLTCIKGLDGSVTVMVNGERQVRKPVAKLEL